MKKKLGVVLFAITLIIGSIAIQNNFTYGRTFFKYEQHKESLKTENSGDAIAGTLVSHLPIISINTNGKLIPGFIIYDENGIEIDKTKGASGEEEIIVDIKIYDNEIAQNTMSREPDLQAKALFNVRGNSSRNFAKTSYKIEFIDEQNIPSKVEVMGMSAGEEWALYAPFLDKTLLRNYMWMNICGNIMEYAPNVRFCECYIDGVYKGVYVMMETIKKDSNRVNVSTYKEGDRIVSYILKLDNKSKDEKDLNSFSSYTAYLDYDAGFTILYPKIELLTEKVKDAISKEISEFEKSLYSYDFKDSKKGYENYIDIDSWVDYYIIQEFLANNDMCSKSTYLYKDKGGKLKMGPVWDFNNVCDNYMETDFGTEGFFYADNRIWYKMLLKDEKFVKKVQARYKELRQTYLSEEYLMNYIDETIEYLGDAIERNYDIWGYTFERENQTSRLEYLLPIERNPQSYQESIEQYKNFLIKRGNWLDENIESLKQYSHYSKNKLYVE